LAPSVCVCVCVYIYIYIYIYIIYIHTHTHTHVYISCPYTCTYTHSHNTQTHKIHTHTRTRTPSPYDKSINFKCFVNIAATYFELLVNSSRVFLRTCAATKCLVPQLQYLRGIQSHYFVWQLSIVSSDILGLQVELVMQWATRHTWLRV